MSSDDKLRLTADPMFKLEHGEADKVRAKKSKVSLASLLELQSTNSTNYYDQNRALRATFRVKRKQLKAQGISDQKLIAHASLRGSAVELLPALESDTAQASKMSFGPGRAIDAVSSQKRAIKRSHIFEKQKLVTNHSKRVRSTKDAKVRRTAELLNC